ncbi:MAG: hypothetical protein L0Y58_16675 [Verrucomicrobia subdivision 3 bacterium]|nr:hypothetical protein [Limisphaerales bacterium]
MQLQYKYNTREEIPKEYEEFYIERDGAWFVDVRGAVDQEAAERRETELAAEREALTGERDALQQRVDELQRVHRGAGASGSGDNPHFRGQPNPFRRETFNLTRQGQLWKADPARAKQLQEAAR